MPILQEDRVAGISRRAVAGAWCAAIAVAVVTACISTYPAIADDWWSAFGDPQLDRLVADATKGNPNLDAALARVAQAQAMLAARDA